jgi:hypothetical protein
MNFDVTPATGPAPGRLAPRSNVWSHPPRKPATVIDLEAEMSAPVSAPVDQTSPFEAQTTP